MVNLLPILEKNGFILEKGAYIGYAANRKGEFEIKLEFKNHYLICIENSVILFSLRFETLSPCALLCILQDYGIVHHRFIYERMETIEKQFDNEYE